MAKINHDTAKIIIASLIFVAIIYLAYQIHQAAKELSISARGLGNLEKASENARAVSDTVDNAISQGGALSTLFNRL
jgi:hypothetical protein